MNTYAGVLLLWWVSGWTLAMVKASLKAQAVALAPVSGLKLPRKSASVAG